MTPSDLAAATRTLHRTYGSRGGLQRALFEARRAIGAIVVQPSAVAHSVMSVPIAAAWPFAPDAERVRATTDRTAAMDRAAQALGGAHEAYRSRWLPRPDAPAEWRRHPHTGFEYDAFAPWFRVPHFAAAAGDVKDVWEPARFSWAFDLARGFMLSRDDRYAEAFWRAFDTFLLGCPPFRGVQWSCGQETTVRALSWLWAEGAMHDAPSSTPDRLGRLRCALAWSGERIASAIEYAISQRNNHGISEATGLIAIGARLRGADDRAAQWIEAGKAHLERLIADQFADDGWYIQHSFSYLRVALDQLVMAQRTLRSLDDGLSGAACARVRASIALLAAVIDADTGAVPNHGSIDGAHVLSLSTRPPTDYRPALTAAAATFGHPLPSDIAPDEETLAWLGAAAPVQAKSRAVPRVDTGASGWVNAVVEGARIFARAGSYGARPGHIDPMHVDVWIARRPVAVDAGTFRYAAPAPWRNGLSAIEVHNTVSIAGRPVARRGPRFLWLSWPSARVLSANMNGGDEIHVELAHESWADQGIAHRRSCVLRDGGAVVIDQLTLPPGESADVTLHWLVDGSADDIALMTTHAHEVQYVTGDASSVFGWVSERYAEKRPALSVRLRARVSGGEPLRIASGFGTAREALALRRHLSNGAPRA